MLIPFILYFMMTSVSLLILLRLLHGLVFGALSTATMASVADTLPREHMGEGIGYFAVFMTLGMILGPLLGLSLLEYNYYYVYMSSLVFAALVFFAIVFLQKSSLFFALVHSFHYSSFHSHKFGSVFVILFHLLKCLKSEPRLLLALARDLSIDG
mgnify:CR=1 FL=1